MDQLLRLNEETLKWHVLCQLLSSSVLERLLKTLYEVCPSFTADTAIVARLYHETEQACLDVVKNFILIGEANRLLQGSSSQATIATQQQQTQVQQTTTNMNSAFKHGPRQSTEPQMRRLAPKLPQSNLIKAENLAALNKLSAAVSGQVLEGVQGTQSSSSSPNQTLVTQLNQNIQMQLRQFGQQITQNKQNASITSSNLLTSLPSTIPSPIPAPQLSSIPLQSTINITPQNLNQNITQQLAMQLNGQQQQQQNQQQNNNAPQRYSTPPLQQHNQQQQQHNQQHTSEVSQAISAQITQNITAHLTSTATSSNNTIAKSPSSSIITPSTNTNNNAGAPDSNTNNMSTPPTNGARDTGTEENPPQVTQQYEKQHTELRNYMDEVKALFDVFNDSSPQNKDAVNALSQAISAGNINSSAIAHEINQMVKLETEIPLNAAAYFPLQDIQPEQKRSSKEKLSCKDCGQLFQYSYQMERHIATRHSYIKKIICDICKKTFGSPGALKRHHETIHQKIKRFTCEDCGKKFGRKDHMKFHISTVHSVKKEVPLDQSIIDAAINNATQKINEGKDHVEDPLNELKQRIRDMTEGQRMDSEEFNHNRNMNINNNNKTIGEETFHLESYTEEEDGSYGDESMEDVDDTLEVVESNDEFHGMPGMSHTMQMPTHSPNELIEHSLSPSNNQTPANNHVTVT